MVKEDPAVVAGYHIFYRVYYIGYLSIGSRVIFNRYSLEMIISSGEPVSPTEKDTFS